MKTENILPGNFYWFNNNWHYIRKWDHLKNSTTLNALHPNSKNAILHHANKDFTSSDAILARCVSTAISLSWNEQQIIEKEKK